MEGVVGQKRARDGILEEAAVEETASKKVCEGSGSSRLLEFGLLCEQEHDALHSGSGPSVPSFSSTAELSSQSLADEGENAGAESKATLEETLRSLEEELGVSDDSTDYSIPSSDVEELSSSALANWGHDIWNVHGFPNQSEDEILVAGDLGCSSESSPTASESPSSMNLSVLDGDACDTTARVGAVDIGFLREASDDELGIPPSPTSEREQSSEREQAGELGSLDVGTDSLHEAVSWALEGGADNTALADSGIEEWMMGNLDFMMDTPVVSYSAVSSLVEASIVL